MKKAVRVRAYMRVNTFGRGLVLALLYIGILLALVVWQFPINGTFTQFSGDMALKGERGKAEGSLVSANLGYGGLVLSFSPERPLRWTAQDGTRKTSLPRSYRTTDDGFLITFSDGIELRAYALKEPMPRAGFEFTRPAGAMKAVDLSVSTARRARISLKENTYFVDGSAGRYLIEVPDGSISANQKNIALPYIRGRIPPVVVRKVEEGIPPATIRFMEQAAMDPAAFNREISAYRDKCWKGLSSTRFVPATVEWKDLSGNVDFSEAALTAYLAEAWSRGMGEAAWERVHVVNERYPDALTYLSVPFLGHTVDRMRIFEEKDLVEVKRIEHLVQEKSPALLEKPGLTHFLLDRAPYSLARDAFQVVQNLDLASLTPAQAVGGLAAWAEAEDLFSPEENPFARFTIIAERQILPSVIKAGEGFFLITGPDETAVLETSIRAGWAFIRLGESTGKSLFVGIGQSLVLGALRLSDANGFLPRAVVLRNGRVADQLDTWAPEDAYPLVAGNPYYPHEISFFKEVGPGAWMWTCSPAVSVSATPERVLWSVEFPEGGVHYLAAYGVKPFTKMRIYGLDYPMDPAFENYNASGYLYRRASNAAYFKMRHKSKIEEIRMFY